MSDPVALRLGRNLRSLEYATDPANRATRLMPLMATVGGLPTYLGFSRWLVTDNTAHVLTLADPAGGAPPVGFDDQLNNGAGDTWYVYRESTAQVYAITDCTLSPNTVTVPTEPGIVVGEYVQFRTSATAGDPIAVGPGAAIGSLARGYINPLVATGISGADLTTVPAPTVDGQYVADDVAFSNYVQTSVGGFSPVDGWPSFTVTITSGSDTTGLAVDDWLLTGDLSWWKGLGGQAESLPPMTVTAINSASELEVTVRGQGPTFRQGLADGVTLLFFRPVAGNLTGTVTDSSASAATVTVDDATSITATGSAPCALELSYTPSIGAVPYYLDHSTYIASVDPGIGVKFGTIQRRSLVGISNLAANGYLRNWTGGVPDGWATYLVGSITGPTFTQLTDPLFTQLGGSSAKITFASANASGVRSEILAWRPAYPGQRFSVRVRLMFPERWAGNLAFDLRMGLQKADGTLKWWDQPDPIVRLVTPTYQNPAAGWHVVPQGVWFDAVLPGFDITHARGLGSFWTVGPADLSDAIGYFLAFFPINSPQPPLIIDGYSITATDQAPTKILEFGEANVGWQETNRALGDLAPPQITLQAAVVDVERMNPSLTPDEIRLGRRALVHVPDLGVVNVSQRMTDVIPNKLVPGDTRIVLAARTQKLTQLLLQGQDALGDQVSTVSDAASGGTAPGTGGTPPGGGTPPPPGGTIVPAISLAVELDASNVPTATAVGNAVVTRVKLAGRTDRYPTADEVRAQTSITSAPFSATYSALVALQTLFVAGLGYDATDNESALATALTTVPGAVSPAPYAMFLRGRGMRTGAYGDHPLSVASTSPAGHGDLLSVWEDQTGHGRHFWGGFALGGDNYDPNNAPTRDGDEVHCGVNPIGTVGHMVARLAGTTSDNWWSQIASGEIHVLIGFRVPTSPPAINSTALWSARAAGDGLGVIRVPDTTGHIVDRAFSNHAHDLGDIASATDLTQRTAYSVAGGGPTASRYVSSFVAKINGTQVFTHDESGAGTAFPYQTGLMLIGRDFPSSEILIGWISDVIVFDQILTDAQEATWTPYILGTTDTPPTESATPSIDYQYAGGDVIVTVAAQFADSVKIDASLSGTPSDADVRATAAIIASPFSKTFPAPTGTDVLHVKAFSYQGALESASATIDIPAEISRAPSDPEFVLAASDADLANARVLTDTSTIEKDTSIAGEVALNIVAGSIGTTELDDTGVTAGTYGDGTHVTQVTVDANGRVTGASNVAITVSGGAGNGRWDPMALRSGQSASALDDDWTNTGTTLSGVWTTGPTWPPTAFDIDTTFPKHLYIRQTAAGSPPDTALRAILQAIPAGDFVIQTEITVNARDANLSHGELILTDGLLSSSNACIITNYQDGTASKGAVQTGTLANITTNLRSQYPTGFNPVVVRIERVSTTYTFEFSPDGIVGERFVLSPGFTATYFGLSVGPYTGELRAAFGAWRYHATPTTRWGAYL